MGTTGEHAAVPEPRPATFEGDAKGLWGRILTPAARTVFASMAVGGALVFGGVALAQSKLGEVKADATAHADAGDGTLRKALEQHVAEEKQARERTDRQLEQLRTDANRKEQADAQRFDALYRTMLSGRAQPDAVMLAQPTTDGGK